MPDSERNIETNQRANVRCGDGDRMWFAQSPRDVSSAAPNHRHNRVSRDDLFPVMSIADENS